MKKNIHPKTNKNVKVTCACGNSFVTQSTVESIFVEICSKCHPLYTGQQKFVDTEGRIDKFNKMLEKVERAKTRVSKAKKGNNKQQSTGPTSLKEALKQAKDQSE